MAERGVLGLFAGSRGETAAGISLLPPSLLPSLLPSLPFSCHSHCHPCPPSGYATCILDEETEQWLLFDGMMQGEGQEGPMAVAV